MSDRERAEWYAADYREVAQQLSKALAKIRSLEAEVRQLQDALLALRAKS